MLRGEMGGPRLGLEEGSPRPGSAFTSSHLRGSRTRAGRVGRGLRRGGRRLRRGRGYGVGGGD